MKKFDLKELYQKEIQNHIQSTNLFLENNFDEFKKFLDFCIKSIKKGNKILFSKYGGTEDLHLFAAHDVAAGVGLHAGAGQNHHRMRPDVKPAGIGGKIGKPHRAGGIRRLLPAAARAHHALRAGF